MRLIAEAAEIARGYGPLTLPYQAPKTLFGAGARSSGRAGAGEDFFSYREYSAGDDSKKIDWRRSARSDDLVIREHDRMMPHQIYMWCDNAPAMHYNSRGGLPTKSYAAQRLMLALAQLLIRGESRVMPLAPHATRNNLGALAQFLSGEHEPILSGLSLPAHSFVMMTSDFRQDPVEWRKFIQQAGETGIHGLCIQMLDPVEHEFPLYGRVKLESAEDEETLVIPSADIMRPIYLERLKAAQDKMTQLCHQYGWQLISLSTDMPARKQLARVIQKVRQP